MNATFGNLYKEVTGCLDYFTDNYSRSPQSFGLIPDAYPKKPQMSSIAATGFGLAAYAVGAHYALKKSGEMYELTLKTLDTLLRLDSEKGFFYHFYELPTGSRYNKCELSTIDTALLFAGALVAGQYFGGAALEKAMELYARADWTYFENKKDKWFYMSRNNGEFEGHWDAYAEQLIMYVLAAGAPEERYRVDSTLYDAMTRFRGDYKGREYIYTWCGSLFVHLFSHAFVDFKDTKDKGGTDWFENSRSAVWANHQFCIDQAENHKTYGENSWGLSACDTEKGYSGRQGNPPSGSFNTEHRSDGTVAPYAAVASMPFAPKEALAALDHFYTLPGLIGKYGLTDSFNLDGGGWYSTNFLGIDKGITLLMISNYLDGFVNDVFMSLPCVSGGMKALGIKKTKKSEKEAWYGKYIAQAFGKNLSGRG